MIEVEADIINGLSAFSIVGLGDSAVQESKERIRSAIKNSGADYPQRKKIINLAPADLRKHGPQFDLPIAISLLAASGQIDGGRLSCALIIGELALDGTVRAVPGVINIAIFAQKNNWKNLIIPRANLREAQLVKKEGIIAVNSLIEAVRALKGEASLDSITAATKDETTPTVPQPSPSADGEGCTTPTVPQPSRSADREGWLDVIGQHTAKRALQIAAAGGHHIALCGSPGVGKTLLAKAFTDILPPLTDEEKIEVIQIHSAAGKLAHSETTNALTETSTPTVPRPSPSTDGEGRPFRQIHQSGTPVALYGGGVHLTPGEISLAHRGVLFMDELPEFSRQVLEQLRQPLEEKIIRISRANGVITYPAQFTLVAGMNPCPCGYFGDTEKECVCSPYQIIRYQKKISGPIADRLDLYIEVKRQSLASAHQQSNLNQEQKQLKQIKQSIIIARGIQNKRFQNCKLNSEMGPRQIKTHCRLDKQTRLLLEKAVEKLKLSGRKYHQIIKIARTIADLEQAPQIQIHHIQEALSYRRQTTIYPQ